jgi:uncharacterized protein YegP (UPF0339 family)
MITARLLCLAACHMILFGVAGAARGEEAGKLKFELYQDAKNEFRWRLKASNGAVLATAGQGYKDKASANHGIEIVQKSATDSKLQFEVFEDAKKEYRWRLKAGNGQIVAASSEGYKAKSGAETAVARIKAGAAKAEVVEVKD